ncbi:MAG: AIR synthase-related protein, partial [Acidimicrobiales bacterium]
DLSYRYNCLVNAMCVGVIEHARLTRAVASGAGNSVLLVGADTGRDGIHGATFASVQLDGSSDERRPAVQVGNPFLEKCLMEACLELAGDPRVVAMQDLGAAGLTSSTAELAHRGGCGIDIDVDSVSRRGRGCLVFRLSGGCCSRRRGLAGSCCRRMRSSTGGSGLGHRVRETRHTWDLRRRATHCWGLL